MQFSQFLHKAGSSSFFSHSPYEAFPDHHPSLKYDPIIPSVFSSGTLVTFNHIFITNNYIMNMSSKTVNAMRVGLSVSFTDS